MKQKLNKEEKQQFRSDMHWVMVAFIGTLLAFSWTMVVAEILDYIWDKQDLPMLAIIISLIYAWIITFFGIMILLSWNKAISLIVDKFTKDENKEEDDDF